MRKASAPRKLSPDVSRRLSDSRRQSAALTLREIHCPFCSFLVEKVFSDAAGHKMVYCRKCKSEYPIKLGLSLIHIFIFFHIVDPPTLRCARGRALPLAGKHSPPHAK